MQDLFPVAPPAPVTSRRTAVVAEFVQPVAARRHAAPWRATLPSGGMPDCLRIETLVSADGTERCVAAVCGDHAVLMHYTFTPQR
ncbi:MAG: hypothetical protein ACTHL1_10625 [Burkholderiaceae bacterium]